MDSSDFEISPNKIGATAQRILDRALEVARQRSHPTLVSEHIFIAFSLVQWDLFSKAMQQDVGLNPNSVLSELENSISAIPKQVGQPLKISEGVNLALRLAWAYVNKSGRQAIEQ